MMNIELKKAIALAIHEGTEFFVYDGITYAGNEDGERAAYEEWEAETVAKGPTAEGWCEWLESEVCELPEYEEDGDYLVLTDKEADEKAAEYIKESLWAFNPSFLAGVTGVDEEVFKAIQANDRCKSNNEAMLRLVGDDLDQLIQDAISSDGRAHFMNTYDGEEHEINLYDVTGTNEYFYVYRIS